MKKKVTCRDNKRRRKTSVASQLEDAVIAERKVRKPRKNRQPPKESTAAVADDDGKDYYCLMCSEKFTSPPTETWIQCGQCKGWCHEACTAGEGSRGFVCDFCL